MDTAVTATAGDKLSGCRDYLTRIGAADIPHSGRDLMAHLQGTFDLLQRWNAPEAVCYAGLFHSVYGTDGFKRNPITTDDRDDVRALVGDEAERLVWLFSSIKRASMLEPGAPAAIQFRDPTQRSAISTEEHAALLHMEYANTLDQCPDMGVLGKFVLTMLGKKWLLLKDRLTPACNAELEAAFAAHHLAGFKYALMQPLFWVLRRL